MMDTFYNEKEAKAMENFEELVHCNSFVISTSDGKKTWFFKKDADGNLLVRPPHHLRLTRVINPASTLSAIAKERSFFEMQVMPLPAVTGDSKIGEVQLLLHIKNY